MLIRSQDRYFLGDIHGIELIEDGTIDEKENRMYALIGYGSISKKLGTYSTEKRALEILDKIQKRLIIGTKFDTLRNNTRVIHRKVFNMPEE